jgi:hypothetical protein
MTVTWSLLGRVLATGAVVGALAGVSWLIGYWIRKNFQHNCKGCGRPLGPTAIVRGDGKFCSVSCADVQDAGWRS